MSWMQESVKDFHQKYGHLNGDINKLPSNEILEFRRKLIEEEKLELEEAIANRDLVKIVDGLGDLLYVIFGFGNILGVDLDPIFQEIHNSNMSKDMPLNGTSKPIKGENYFPPDLKMVLSRMMMLCNKCGDNSELFPDPSGYGDINAKDIDGRTYFCKRCTGK